MIKIERYSNSIGYSKFRAGLRACTDLLQSIPSRNDSWPQKIVKSGSIIDIFYNHFKNEAISGIERFAEENGLLGTTQNTIVALFWSTPLNSLFKSTIIPIEGLRDQRLNKMYHKDIGALYFIEYTTTQIIRDNYVLYEPGVDLSKILKLLWDNYNNHINLTISREISYDKNISVNELPEINGFLFGKSNKLLKNMIVKHSKYQKDNVSRTYLLVGEPGVGKTVLVNKMANKIGKYILRIDAQSLLALGVPEMKLILNGLCPHVLIIDDVDKAEMGKSLPTILTVMEWVKYEHQDVTLLITTNSTNMNSSLLRPGRIDEVIQIKLPDEQDRKKIFEGYFTEFGINTKLDDKILKETEGMSAAWLKEIALQMKYENFDTIMNTINDMKQLIGEALNKPGAETLEDEKHTAKTIDEIL